jgi:hypothetical protein
MIIYDYGISIDILRFVFLLKNEHVPLACIHTPLLMDSHKVASTFHCIYVIHFKLHFVAFNSPLIIWLICLSVLVLDCLHGELDIYGKLNDRQSG